MREKRTWIYDLLLLAVLVVAAYLRLTGVEWGEGQHQHPDELFLSGVTENLRAHVCKDADTPIDACPPDHQRWMNPIEYFNTATSTLNPRNRGAAFYVYGNLPVTLVRVAYEALGPEVAGPTKYFGRQFSALADLFTIFILYFIVARLYNRKTALLAAAFSALAVMEIQQSHFFTVDLFMNPFMFAALYFAVRIAYPGKQVDTYPGIQVDTDILAPVDAVLETQDTPPTDHATTRPSNYPTSSFIFHLSSFLHDPLFWNSLLFGIFLGMAAACKINAVVLAVALPVALWLRFSHQLSVISEQSTNTRHTVRNTIKLISDREAWSLITVYLVVGGLATLLAFRVFQPYAFDMILPNAQWLANMKEIRAQATGLADLPWNLQWARRTHLYSFTNLTVWGLGLPLGILAWAGFLFMGWHILKGERQHILLWVWTAVYFTWQSLQFNATMRYQLPIYPLLCMMAAWIVSEGLRNTKYAIRVISIASGSVVLILTAIWAFAFLSVYTHDETRMAASRWIFQNVPGPITLHYEDGTSQPLPFPSETTSSSSLPYTVTFTAAVDSTLTDVLLPHTQVTTDSSATVSLSLLSTPDASAPLAIANASVNPLRDSVTLAFDRPVVLKKDQTYSLQLLTTGEMSLAGAGIANETDYDWNLPFRIDNYDPFGGMYRGDLNLQVYWDDNADKLARFENILDQTDYIFIPTNHQYAQITRIPERYPLATVYYRELIGCPPDKNIIWCYRVAEPGTFQGRLGFELVKTFESYPTLGPLVINDQAAEEAFTFYDHPKVLIFKKNADYDSAKVAAVLGAVDLTKVIHLLPSEAGSYKPPKTLMLPADRLAQQQAGGTWSQLYSYDWLQNKYPYLGLVIWYVFIFLLGLVTYPLARRALPGLADKGYALSRILGLVLLAYVTWMLGSLGVPVSRGLIAIVFGAITLVGAWQAWVQKDALIAEWKSNRRMILIIEGLFLLLFLLDLFIRIGNPDLWHPARGGERPMDFSYFNAVLKSTTFPPYDPWFAGGYINYYYYGFVLVGMPVKLLGIVPSIAYNMILPTLFGLVGVGAFMVGYNLVRVKAGTQVDTPDNATSFTRQPSPGDWSLITGFAATSLTLLLGNLGTIQLIWKAFQRIAAPGGTVGDVGLWQRLIWGFEGMWKSINGASLPIGIGDWYWNPSRVIPPGPGNEITEFPLFTFIYSDLHAHMIVLPLALFVIAWLISLVKTRGRLSRVEWLISFLAGALVLGAVYPTNLSDFNTYLLLAVAGLAYVFWFHVDAASLRLPISVPKAVKRAGLMIASIVTFSGLSFVLYQPYRAWYSQAYGALDSWPGPYTPVSSYLTHWGLFLFIVVAWLAWETREWMANTPLSSLSKLRPYSILIEAGLAAFLIALAYFALKGVWIGWVALPLAAWAGALILRKNQPDEKRLALFFIGTALLITMVVELKTVRGDIGRMNTVFKFYMQSWVFLSVSAAAALGWTLPAVPSWRMRWRSLWQVGLTLLLAGAAFFSLSASMDKIRDRMNPDAPHTLDSMTYMETATFWDTVNMDLGQDYRAIRWMQDNVQGSPVIVEGNCPEYRWCTRFTIYTGLPGVVGWNWHQRQQRGFVEPMLVENRIAEIAAFYTTTDPAEALAFLKKYNVRYIVVGQVESVYYPGDGLRKFEQYNGAYWTEVFRDGQTVIYQVK